jgi:2-succinyl-5-enolpyruvyl-6-hydroxy-3-cyclohexene-1-carboxylate synthase
LSAILPSERLTEMTVISELSLHLPQGACLFLGNSLAIRLYDMLARPDAQAPEVMANRGASGIDGLLSTAVGCQLAEPTRPLCLVLGDMSLLHDLNGLALLQQVEGPMVVILLNNGGGSIFRMMPVPENRLEAFYSLPRQVDFASSCAQFGIPHVRPASLADYAGAMHSAWLRAGATVIEICTPPAEATDWLRALGQKEHG